MKRFISYLLALCYALMLLGCGGSAVEPPPADDPYQRETTTSSLTICLDFSGSFLEIMSSRGWDMIMKLLAQYFRGTGDTDTLVITQLSGAPGQGPIWRGSPRTFRTQFPDANAFGSWLRTKVSPAGSRIWESVNESFRYATENAGPQTKLLMVVVTDGDDNASPPGAEDRVVKNLERFAQLGGSVGFYWLDPGPAAIWRPRLERIFRPGRYLLVDKIDNDVRIPETD